MAKRPPEPTEKPAAKTAGTPSKPGTLSHESRFVVLQGPEGFLRSLYTTQLKNILTKHHGQVDTIVLDGTNAQPADVLDECRSFGLIATHKLIIVDQAEAMVKADTRPLFERYAENPSDGATLVLRSGNWKAGNLDKMIEKVGAVIRCEAPGEDACVRWAIKRAASEHKARLEPDAAQALVACTGADLGRIDTELGKLAAAAGDGPITPAHVAQFVGVSRDEEAWGVQQSMLAGNAEQALHHLRHVLDVSRQPATLVMWSVTDLARKLHGVCCAIHQKRNVNEVTRPLKMWGPSQSMIINAAQRMKPADTMAFLRACIKADQRAKSGLTDADRSLEVLTLHLQRLL